MRNESSLLPWGLCIIFYFYQYALRSAPSVMVPEIVKAYDLTALGVSSLLGLYYWAYAPLNLIAGAALDRFGAKRTIPIGILVCSVGVLLFGLGDCAAASSGRLLQGAGSAFAFVGAVYVATRYLPNRQLALAVGTTQMFGMLGGWAGQAPVGHLLYDWKLPWQIFWLDAAAVGGLLAALVWMVLPNESSKVAGSASRCPQSMLSNYNVVARNSQTWLCGICAGLLFLPTTVGAMIWGVSFLQNGYGVPRGQAVDIIALVPLGWVMGCPLLGFVSDRLSCRKPVLLGGAFAMLITQCVILYLDPGSIQLAGWSLVFFILGVTSGTAMLPYTIIKEASSEQVKGSALGALGFINFSCSAVLAPLFGWLLLHVSDERRVDSLTRSEFQLGLGPLVIGIALAITASLWIKETGACPMGQRQF